MFRLLLISALVALAFGQDGPTEIKNHPYQVSVEEKTVRKCSGALIKENIVITVAQCVSGKKPSDLTVRAGTDQYAIGGETATVSRMCVHESYSSATKDYDIAALLLSRSFTKSTLIAPIVMIQPSTDLPAGEVATVTGWKILNVAGTILEQASVSRMDHQTCIDAYADQLITKRMACYKAPGKDCKTDYGALLVRGARNDARQLGLMSWGSRGVCGDDSFPAVYTDIGNDEIHKHIDQCFATFAEEP